MSLPADYFEQLFTDSPDPWAFRQRWYEKRKRDLCLASLGQQRYPRVFEPACANGELSLALAERSEHLLCLDASAPAVDLTRQRLHALPHCRVLHGYLPDDWPPGQFDLIVLSEVGYYLDAEHWRRTLEHAVASLAVDGTLLACHWLHPIADCPQTGHQVHALLARHLPLHRVVRHEEPDFLLELWCRQPSAIDLNEHTL